MKLNKSILARYNMTSVELKTFTFSGGTQSPTIDNAVLCNSSKRLLFTMLRNIDYLASTDSNPYHFIHFDLNYFSLFVNGKQFPNGGLSLDMGHEKTSVMGTATCLRDRSSTTRTQAYKTHLFISGYFMLLFNLTPDRAASEAHKSHSDNFVVRIELKFARPVRGHHVSSLPRIREHRIHSLLEKRHHILLRWKLCRYFALYIGSQFSVCLPQRSSAPLRHFRPTTG
jgi:hypothetical protein